MKRILILMLLSIASRQMNAAISKVYVALANENFSSIPVNGNLNWSTYIGLSKLAFASGYSYKVKIEYTSGSAGGIRSTSTNALISGIVKTGETYDFKLDIPSSVPRLSTFKMGLQTLNASPVLNSDMISCEVVEIGRFYSMIISDSSATTRYTRGTQNMEVTTITWKKGTGPKYFRFAGGGFTNAKFLPATTAYSVGGITIDPFTITRADINYIEFKLKPTTINSSPASLKEVILAKIFDAAVDKPYPWVSYKYAEMEPPSGFPNQGFNPKDRTIEHIYGLIYTLNKYEEGFNIFLNSNFVVD